MTLEETRLDVTIDPLVTDTASIFCDVAFNVDNWLVKMVFVLTLPNVVEPEAIRF